MREVLTQSGVMGVGALVSEQQGCGGRDVSQPGVVGEVELIARRVIWVKGDGEGHWVEGVAGLGDQEPFRASRELTATAIPFPHVIGVSMVGGDNHRTASSSHLGDDSPHAMINAFNRFDCRLEISGVTDHVAVGEIDSSKIEGALLDFLKERFGDLVGRHFWGLVKWGLEARNLSVGFEFFGEVAAAIAIPEVGYVPVFLGFTAGPLANPCFAKHLTQGSADLGRRD